MGDTGGYGVASKSQVVGLEVDCWTNWVMLWRGETSLSRPTSLIVRHSM